MANFEVVFTKSLRFSNIVEVEAEDKEEAIELAFDLIDEDAWEDASGWDDDDIEVDQVNRLADYIDEDVEDEDYE